MKTCQVVSSQLGFKVRGSRHMAGNPLTVYGMKVIAAIKKVQRKKTQL
jgi:hypothetical protein